MKLLATSFILALPFIGQASPVTYSILANTNDAALLTVVEPTYRSGDWISYNFTQCNLIPGLGCIEMNFHQIDNPGVFVGVEVTPYVGSIENGTEEAGDFFFANANTTVDGSYAGHFESLAEPQYTLAVGPVAPEPSTIGFMCAASACFLFAYFRQRVRNSPVG